MSADSDQRAGQLYRALFEQSRDAVLILAEDGTVLDANAGALDLFGLDADSARQHNAADFWVDPSERARLRAAVARAGHVRDFPAQLRTQQGTVIDCIVSGTAYLLPDGTTIFQSIVRDESERLRQEDELRERVKELRCLYDVSRALSGEGVGLDELLARVVELLPPAFQYPEVAEARLELEALSRQTRGFTETAWQLGCAIDADGRQIGRITVAYRACRKFLPEELELLDGVSERISECWRRREAEAALARREAHYRMLIENATDMIAIVDREGVVRWASPSGARMVGVDEAELPGLRAVDFVHPEDWPVVAESLAQAIQDPAGIAIREFRARRADGVYRWVETVARPLLVGGEQHVLCVSRDCTDRRLLMEQLHQSQKMDAVGQLAGAIAHDFNNILTVIESNADFLIEQLPPGEQASEDAREIRKASVHAATLTRRLLAFSKRQVLEPRVLEVDALIDGLDTMLKRLIGENIDVTTTTGAGGACVLADAGQLEQVLFNLFVNARDAMPAGGKLVLRSERVRLAQATADLQPGDYVRLSVADTGVGIAAAALPLIFDPFFTTKSKGTGLGLSTVYGIVRQSGGSIQVASVLGKGTTFHVFLPEHAAAAVREDSRLSQRPTRAHETVLLVEDEAAVRAPAQRALQNEGYAVLVAAGPLEALRIAREHRGVIDALVSDVVMPDMSGPEMAEHFALLRPDAAVLFVSGYPDDELERHGFAESGARFLAKPFSPDRLCRALREALLDRRSVSRPWLACAASSP